ncbi:thiamine-phosphate kinase [Arthrobacter sp. TPD3018]|uniref:thiamine-phosphate kinase n=1 Tax=Bacteria TaxID=2 RepID=UPI000D50E17B|nr:MULTISPECIES: thiamine-phosphate kinase [Bacteria]PVE53495.1 thiamine-phosphate kinase [Sphingomonas sp. TPD3009]PVE56068.1 thiamine-phosphate kinase [Arthrobacter sp. TPD3018]PVE81666.1 thiamine-phosphate kinase [Sphingomonas melonis]
MTEADFLAALRTLPLHPAARGLNDDSARLTRAPLVVTTDTLVEGVHFLASDTPQDVAWKLVATNLSDIAGKGGKPDGILLNYPLTDDAWDRAFLEGLAAVLTACDAQILGGDTVRLPPGAPRVLTVTAFGCDTPAPPRGGAGENDALWVTGTIGEAGAGLAIAQGQPGPAALAARYRRPTPRLAEGRILARLAHAMMDVSDGLLIDAARMAAASNLAVIVDLAAVPLSPAYIAHVGTDRTARLTAASAGDDYELLFAMPANVVPPVAATPIGRFARGEGLHLFDGGEPVPLPDRLGFQH